MNMRLGKIKKTLITLLLTLGCGGLAFAALTFTFSYVTSYGTNGESAPYAGPSATGQSYARDAAISRSDTNQHVYSLVQENTSNSTGGYQGPYHIVRRNSDGSIDTTFGSNGYLSTFPNSANTSYQFNSLCVDPGTGYIVVAGSTNTGGNTPTNEAVVERLVAGAGTASYDSSFANAGMATFTLPNGNNNPNPDRCEVSNKGSGSNGAIGVVGEDNVYPSTCTGNCAATSGMLFVAKLNGNGSMNSGFGSGGVAEYSLPGGLVPEVSGLAGNANQSTVPDEFIFGDGYPSGNSSAVQATIVAVDRCNGSLDTHFNSTGTLVNPSYASSSNAVLGRLTDDGNGNASNLYALFVNTSNLSGVFAQYPITGAVPNTSSPATTSGTITFPSGFTPRGGAVLNASGQGVVSGNSTASAEVLAEVGGTTAIGYTPSSAADTASCAAAATPGFSPAAGTYSSSQTVTISDATAGAAIYYTTDGSTPTTASTLYTAPVTVSSSETIKAVAIASGHVMSAVGSAAYSILSAAATPTFSPAAGTYATSQMVTISDSTAGATIYYTTDGSTPTHTSTVYSTAITVASNETIKALASASGFADSSVGSAAYVIQTATVNPTFAPAAGTYASSRMVTLSDATTGATIYYTTDGSTPTVNSSTYTAAITVASNETIKAFATAPGFNPSSVVSATYSIMAAVPAFTPVPGTYAGSQMVTLSDATTGATIYYTTDGSTPTTSSIAYTTPITVSSSATIKAIATASNFANSAVAVGTYTINTGSGGGSASGGGGAFDPTLLGLLTGAACLRRRKAKMKPVLISC